VPRFSVDGAPAAPHGGVRAALHPGRCAAVLLGDCTVGWIGELHPRLCKTFDLPGAPVLFEVEVPPLLDVGLPHIQAVAHFPALVRDIAVWIGVAVRAGEVLEDLRTLSAATPQLAAVRSVVLFDVFRPPAAAPAEASPQGVPEDAQGAASGLLIKEKSLAFRIVLQDTQRSLAEADADAARAAIVDHLLERWGARPR
jgi:phenylalanyl-tRNA synthetase beta chain